MNLRRPLFVLNPAARGGRAVRLLPLVRQSIAEHGGAGEVVCTERARHATSLAREAAVAGFDAVIGVGGDGTLQEIANGLVTSAQPLPIGVVPTGAGNDFVRSLGLPTSPSAAVALAWSTAERSVDLAACGERFFLNAGGAGFDARVARAAQSMPSVLRFGALPYVAGVLRELMHNTAHELTIHLDDRTLQRRALMVAVANGAFYGGGMMICPDASRDDGLLDICVVGEVSRREVLRLLSAVFSGKHVGDPHVELFRTRTVRIESAQPCELHLDGELAGTLPAEFRAVPNALRVLVGSGSGA